MGTTRMEWVEGADIDRLWHSLRAQIRQQVACEHQADDIVQETWLRTLMQPPRPRGRLKAWFRVVARRLLFESLRAQEGRLRREQQAARTELVAAADDSPEEEPRIVRMVQELPQPYREVVHLRYVVDWG